MHTSRFKPFQVDQFAVEGIRAFGAKGIAPGAGHEETDPDWLPV